MQRRYYNRASQIERFKYFFNNQKRGGHIFAKKRKKVSVLKSQNLISDRKRKSRLIFMRKSLGNATTKMQRTRPWIAVFNSLWKIFIGLFEDVTAVGKECILSQPSIQNQNYESRKKKKIKSLRSRKLVLENRHWTKTCVNYLGI